MLFRSARIAEIVVNTLPKERTRETLHKEPRFYAIRNHLVDFLVSRSRRFSEELPADYDPKNPPLVTPGLETQPEPPAPKLPVPEASERSAVVVNFR